ncbi:hypothetical protein [Kutzneria sp. 744]|uniref:hypothetical protein n=1 Tax=Kutzneria sp. (strain 744) TaxID=345341 RepID=UPI0012FA86E1|nr:hypothetical protein [Kutzneria sp. 744]
MDAQIAKGDHDALQAAKTTAADWIDTFDVDSPEYQVLIECLATLGDLDRTTARAALSARYGDNDPESVIIDGIFNFMTQVSDRPETKFIVPGDLTPGEAETDDRENDQLNTVDADLNPKVRDSDHGYRPGYAENAPQKRVTSFGLHRTERTSKADRWTTPLGLRDWSRKIHEVGKEVVPALVRTRKELAERVPNWLCVVSYCAYRLGVDDDAKMTEGDSSEYLGYSFADEKRDNKKVPLKALPCVACDLPRSRTSTVTASRDNGLCPECAKANRAGFPRIIGDRQDKVVKRCEWLATRYPGTLLDKLTGFAAQSGKIDRSIIRKWADSHVAHEIREDEAAQAAVNDDRRAADAAKALTLADEFPNAIVPIFRVWWNTEPGRRAVVVRALTALRDAGRIESTIGKSTLTPATVRTTATPDAATLADERARLARRFPTMAERILNAWADEVTATQPTTSAFTAVIAQVVTFARTYPRAAHTVITAWLRPEATLTERAAVHRARQQLIKSGEFVTVDGELTANPDRWTRDESGQLTLTPAEELSAA